MPAYISAVTLDGEEHAVDWDGPGVFYYRVDKTKALVLTTVDDPDRDPAFTSAADLDALIASGDWDLPADAFTVIAPLVWMPEPAQPEPEEQP